MKDETPREKKADKMIGCRPAQSFYEAFMKVVEDIGVQQTDLAELAMKKGLQLAAEELRAAQIQEHKEKLRRLREVKFQLFFNLPHFASAASRYDLHAV